jgi:acyl-coenzyme A thioesterase PaaI-like protein
VEAFQDLIPYNHCWGCGPLNDKGLHFKSYWGARENETVCRWTPYPEHMAGPTTIVNGGIIATVIDCHCLCSAVAAAYRDEGRPMNSEPLIWYATAELHVDYKKPTRIGAEVELLGRIEKVDGRRTLVTCTLFSEGQERATGRVVAVRVAEEWRR